MKSYKKQSNLFVRTDTFRRLFFFFLSALLLAGCGKEDENYKFENSETGVKAIFNVTIEKTGTGSETRAADQAWAIGDKIGITCMDQYLPEYDQLNFEYRTSSTTGTFSAVNNLKEIWFLGANNYSITAYYPFTGEVGLIPKPITSITNTENQLAKNQPLLDYLFASNTASRDNPNVDLTFSHRMSRLVIQFESAKDDEGKPVIDLATIDCFLMNVKQTGTFTPSTGIAIANETENLTDKNIKQTLNINNGHKLSLILFPQPKVNAKLDAILKNEEFPNGVYYTIPLDDLQLKAGFSYNYKVIAKRDADNKIMLAVTQGSIVPWDEVDNVEIESNAKPVQTNVEGTVINEWTTDGEVNVESK